MRRCVMCLILLLDLWGHEGRWRPDCVSMPALADSRIINTFVCK